jgi:2'-5' RNA ligase
VAKTLSALSEIITAALKDAAVADSERDFAAHMEDARSQCDIVKRHIERLLAQPYLG